MKNFFEIFNFSCFEMIQSCALPSILYRLGRLLEEWFDNSSRGTPSEEVFQLADLIVKYFLPAHIIIFAFSKLFYLLFHKQPKRLVYAELWSIQLCQTFACFKLSVYLPACPPPARPPARPFRPPLRDLGQRGCVKPFWKWEDEAKNCIEQNFDWPQNK